ncbi:MAG: hypothetical protein JXB88_23195, partial [Spirochaetales bacterium]|nr:hypothetical protein [Spirochaetales bacterium]
MEDALALAEIKGFLQVKDKVYSISPQKRHLLSIIHTFQDADERLEYINQLLNIYCKENNISYKEIVESRITYFEETAKTDVFMAIAACKALEDDYLNLVKKDPDAARAVAFAKSANAELCGHFKEYAIQQEVIDQLIKEFGSHPAGAVVEKVASAL